MTHNVHVVLLLTLLVYHAISSSHESWDEESEDTDQSLKRLHNKRFYDPGQGAGSDLTYGFQNPRVNRQLDAYQTNRNARLESEYKRVLDLMHSIKINQVRGAMIDEMFSRKQYSKK
eukprot:TRINITY_DN1947_c0_g1_i2.p1 TRINITY_DN1947_c0_g1~~TRINITY_DN1947_c0_g1_i2.p1  ORF type:complete len:117 (+),score=15.88 TRINITY_DN1947_c0_g1_i2:37-387(+)